MLIYDDEWGGICVNTHMASAAILDENESNFSVAECFLQKPIWCRNEQVCQRVK